ncbi:chymotrypsin-like protease CTRL-1 [Mustela nigripes]|uniref:Chymotrypsin like n=2 Tax=Mustela putorius furo TaxID=9669 RepID=M3Y5X7_MUSPF|nr:chymotrypsin-like protease CTRL-1 [Mustela putorius furo]XP_059009269.1 chymotrypsin-like protease CTRL-1 [Mustela lutreola]XP_059237547.1 chymotrypsin-like protease CTRL-1 [Mustela nigripes]
MPATMLLLSLTLSLVFLGSSWGCGVPAIKPLLSSSQRIVNGENAVPGSWPWQVSLQDRSGFHFCGGSLISQSWVVTAAHCNVSPGRHVVVLGEYDRSSGAEPLQVLSISKAITHPSWNPNTLNNDLTLLKLAAPAQYTKRISPVCVASSNEALPAGLKCATTGWGRLSGVGNTTPARLQQVALPLVTVNQCRQYWGSRITDSMICAGGAGASSCQGDSGGPLVCQKGNTWVLIGVVSWGTSNCNVRQPAIYTRVSKFSNWINQVVASN